MDDCKGTGPMAAWGEEAASMPVLGLMRELETEYHYHSLSKEYREFRLLELLPLPKSPDLPLQCRIKHVSMNDHAGLEYEAISYYWGDPAPCRAIKMDGLPLLLPINSEKALRRMALPDRIRLVFLDAACVNQQDLVERATQVVLMGDIYRHAQATLVHLGDAVETTAQAFANIRNLHLELQERAKSKGRLQNFCDIREVARHPLKTPLNQPALVELFQRPWFSRVWVVQEVAVAAKSTLICGTEEVDAKIVLELTRWLAKSYFLHTSEPLSSSLATVEQMWEVCWLVKANGCLSTTEVLNSGRFLQATDPRDKIFGMFGLLDRTHASTSLLTPDYTKPVNFVIRDAVRQCFADSQLPFMILSEAYHSEDPKVDRDGIPSWVPRLDLPQYQDSISQTAPLVFHDDSETSITETLVSTTAARITNEPNILPLDGIELCSIEQVSPPCIWEPSQSDKPFEAFMQWLVEEIIPFSHKFNQSIVAVARTIITDTDFSSGHRSKDSRRGLRSLLEYFRDGVSVPYVWDEDYMTPEEAIDGEGARGGATALASSHFHSMVLACQGRRCADLGKGERRMVGLVPHVARAGDLVGMMQGAHMPLVIRPEGRDETGKEVFTLIGECYVDGWMLWQCGEHGEELRAMMLDEEELKTFRIR